jgi:hypothetical protein
MFMKRREGTILGQEPGQTGEARPEVDAQVPVHPASESGDFIDGARLLRIMEGGQVELDETGDTANLPRITRMPEGIEVVEQRAGAADGQWLLQVRCQCGRRWFELEAIPATTCPRCGLYVYVNIASPRPPA